MVGHPCRALTGIGWPGGDISTWPQGALTNRGLIPSVWVPQGAAQEVSSVAYRLRGLAAFEAG